MVVLPRDAPERVASRAAMDRQQQQYKARVEANRVVEQQSQALRAAEEDEKLLEEYAEAMRSLEAAVGAGNTPPAGVMVNATAGLLRAANVEYRAAMAALSAAHAMYVTERNAVVASACLSWWASLPRRCRGFAAPPFWRILASTCSACFSAIRSPTQLKWSGSRWALSSVLAGRRCGGCTKL